MRFPLKPGIWQTARAIPTFIAFGLGNCLYVAKCMKYIPSKSEISLTHGADLDERSALSHFYGLDYRQAVGLFDENFHCYIEDLKWMGDSAFLYYLQSVEIFLYDNDYGDDPLSLFVDSCYVADLFIIKSGNDTSRKRFASNRSAISICKFFVEKIECALKMRMRFLLFRNFQSCLKS